MTRLVNKEDEEEKEDNDTNRSCVSAAPTTDVRVAATTQRSTSSGVIAPPLGDALSAVVGARAAMAANSMRSTVTCQRRQNETRRPPLSLSDAPTVAAARST